MRYESKSSIVFQKFNSLNYYSAEEFNHSGRGISFVNSHFIKSGTSYWSLNWEDSETASDEELQKVEAAFRHIHISIEYRSVYGDKFKAYR